MSGNDAVRAGRLGNCHCKASSDRRADCSTIPSILASSSRASASDGSSGRRVGVMFVAEPWFRIHMDEARCLQNVVRQFHLTSIDITRARIGEIEQCVSWRCRYVVGNGFSRRRRCCGQHQVAGGCCAGTLTKLAYSLFRLVRLTLVYLALVQMNAAEDLQFSR